MSSRIHCGLVLFALLAACGITTEPATTILPSNTPVVTTNTAPVATTSEGTAGAVVSTISPLGAESQPSFASSEFGAPDCDPPSPVAPRGLLWEAPLTSNDLSGWALIWEKPPLTVGEEVKIVFRIDGSGDATFRGINSSGVSIDPTWGPIPHQESNWERPGDEWGMAFTFAESDCWSIEVFRGDTRAYLWLDAGS